MAYKRGLPTFNKGIEPEVKRTTVQNPEGTTTYKTSWSSKTPARSTSFKAPEAKQGTKTSYVAKRSTPAQTTSGEREITTFPTITPKPTTVSLKPEANVVIQKPREKTEREKNDERIFLTREKYKQDKMTWEEEHPGKKWEERYKDAKPAKKEKWQGKGSFKEKKAIKLCKTC
jgi:hypothetical protein